MGSGCWDRVCILGPVFSIILVPHWEVIFLLYWMGFWELRTTWMISHLKLPVEFTLYSNDIIQTLRKLKQRTGGYGNTGKVFCFKFRFGNFLLCGGRYPVVLSQRSFCKAIFLLITANQADLNCRLFVFFGPCDVLWNRAAVWRCLGTFDTPRMYLSPPETAAPEGKKKAKSKPKV